MIEIGIYEARNNMSELIKRVQAGEEFLITKRGEEVAILASASRIRCQQASDALTTMRNVFKAQPSITLEEMTDWSKEGRW